MTLRELLDGAYGWAVANRLWILLAGALAPVVGTLLARAGKAGKTDAERRAMASVVVGVGIAAVILEVLALFVARNLMGRSPLKVDVLLAAAPLVCLTGCLAGIRWVFPLCRLASVRTFGDAGAFLLACAAVLWLFSGYRWGIQLAVIAVFGCVLLRRLHGRAFGQTR